MKTDHCEHPNHEQYSEAFSAKYPTASKHWGYWAIINADPKVWAKDLEYPQKNTAKCCQVCSISEDIRTSFRNISISNYLSM